MSQYASLLGIDYGFRRIGLATGQTITSSASVLDTIPNQKNKTNWTDLDQVIHTWRPDAFILGLPLHADGTESEMTQAVKQFAKALQTRYEKDVIFQNEHLSSREAESILQQHRASGRATKRVQKEDIDKLAAAIILQRWLDNH